MGDPVKIGFEQSVAVLPLSALLPLKTVPEAIKQTAKYKQIARSVREIGIIEPLVVARSKDQSGRYLLLDGHMRYAALTDNAAEEVRCLVAEDDEAYTYNKRINRLACLIIGNKKCGAGVIRDISRIARYDHSVIHSGITWKFVSGRIIDNPDCLGKAAVIQAVNVLGLSDLGGLAIIYAKQLVDLGN